MDRWWKDIEGSLKRPYQLMVKVEHYLEAGNQLFPWDGKPVSDNMDENVDIVLAKGQKRVNTIPAKNAKGVYLWLLQNNYLIEDETLVPQMNELL